MKYYPFSPFIIWFFCLWATGIQAQLSATISVNEATCGANGSITVNASNGSGNYNYTLSGSCLGQPSTQSFNVFNSLAACDYLLTVTDGQSGQSVQEIVTVPGEYEPLNLLLDCNSCSILAQVTGGLPPYNFSISTSGLNGSYVLNDPPDNNVFTNLTPGQLYYVIVTDSCPLSQASAQCQAISVNINFGIYRVGDSLRVNVNPPTSGNYLYTLTSDAGTFTNNQGHFPLSELGCNAYVTVNDGCTETTKPYDPNPNIHNLCPNFADGTATMELFGTPPFIAYCGTPNGTFQSTDGTFTGLPVNADYYNFRVRDGCGRTSSTFWRYKPSPAFSSLPTACNDSTLQLAFSFGHCGPGFNVGVQPVEVQCLSCPGMPVDTLDYEALVYPVTFSGSELGEWELSFVNQCDDHLICQDQVLLDVQPYCDSLRATLVDRFYCDNGTVSDRLLETEGSFFYLKNNLGEILDSNISGLFQGLAAGEYTVELNHPICGAFTATAEVGVPKPFQPNFTASIFSREIDGSCIPTYTLRFPKSNGEMLLTGNGQTIIIDEDDLDGACLNYYVRNLVPGEYILSPLGFCAADTIFLPMPDYELSAVGDGTCPGDGTVNVEGARTRSEWINWASSLDFGVSWSDNAYDQYGLNNDRDEDYTGSPFTFHSVAPGLHTVYLYAFSLSCPLDTVEVVVPESVQLAASISQGVLCDGASSTDVEMRITGGLPPFTISKYDCNDPAVVLNSFIVTDSIVHLDDIQLGDHCYGVVDGCQSGVGSQVSVYPYGDSIDVAFNCDNTVTLTLDSVIADFAWRDAAGTLLGNARQLVLPMPAADINIFASINIGSCVLQREITVSPQPMQPSLSLVGNEHFCQGQPANLQVETDASSILWSTGETTNQVQISQGGTYSVTVENNLGCTLTDSISVGEVSAVDPVIMGDLSFCSGDSNWLWIAGDFAAVVWSDGTLGDSVLAVTTGPYMVEATDTFGCTWTSSVALTEYQLPEPVILGESRVCVEATTELSVSQNYSTFQWSNGSDLMTINVEAGNYAVTVTDDNGCAGSVDFTVEEWPVASVRLSTDTVACQGDTVALSVAINHQQGSLTIDWDTPLLPGPLVTADDTVLFFIASENLQAAIHSVSMSGHNCPVLTPDTVFVRVQHVDLEIMGDPGLCPGVPNLLWVEGSFPAVNWSNGMSGDSIYADTATIYAVEVTDSTGCIWQAETAVTEHPAPQPIISGDSVVCENETTLLSVSPPFSAYQWSNGSTDEEIPVPPGSHSLTVTDANGCEGVGTFTVAEIPIISVRLKGDTLVCQDSLVTISVQVENAPGAVDLYWDVPVLPSPVSVEYDTAFSFFASQNWDIGFDSLIATDYECPFDVQGSALITTNEVLIVVDAPTPFNGYPVSCHGANDGTATVWPTAGTSPFTYHWSNQQNTAGISGLASGVYSVTVTDSMQCTTTGSVLLEEPAPITVDFLAEPPRCFNNEDGWVEIGSATGGVGGIEVSFNGDIFEPLPIRHEAMPPGRYDFTFEDANYCTLDTSIYFPPPLELQIDIGSTLTIPLGNSERLQPVANFTVDSLWWEPATWLDNPTDWDPISRPLENVRYTLTAWDEYQCPATATVLVRVDKSSAIYAPNSFSPNGDGINDNFTLFARPAAVSLINSLIIFDRWGNQVFEQRSFFPNRLEEGWNGKFRGKPLAPNTFVWMAEVEYIDGHLELLKGELHLIR